MARPVKWRNTIRNKAFEFRLWLLNKLIFSRGANQGKIVFHLITSYYFIEFPNISKRFQTFPNISKVFQNCLFSGRKSGVIFLFFVQRGE